jgi:hypothetical protein
MVLAERDLLQTRMPVRAAPNLKVKVAAALPEEAKGNRVRAEPPGKPKRRWESPAERAEASPSALTRRSSAMACASILARMPPTAESAALSVRKTSAATKESAWFEEGQEEPSDTTNNQQPTQ